MFIEQVFVALLAAAQLTNGAAVTPKQAFTVNQVASGRTKLRSAALDAEKTYKKYGATVPEGISRLAAKAVKGSVAADPAHDDSEYVAAVQIGSPSQTLDMDFDTGSSDFWVFSNELPRKDKKGHEIYKPSKSKTSKQLSGESWSIKYGDGSGASGNVYADKVVIGGVTATSQAVEAATSVSKEFIRDKSSNGLVGLAFDNINTVKPDRQMTFWQNVGPQLQKQVFAADLNHKAPGAYDFGFIDHSKFDGDISYANVDSSDGFWQFTAGGYAVGGSATQNSFAAITDTGTSLLYVPSDAASAYYSQVSGAMTDEGLYIFPCTSSLPSFSVIVGKKKHTVPPAYLNYATLGKGYCIGGLQPNTGLPASILGDVFIQSQYTVFDFGNTKVGFGQKRA